MLSLKKTIDGLDREEQRFQTLLDCYLDAIHGVEEQAVEVSPELTEHFQVQLRNLHREVGEDSSPSALEKCRGALVAALKDYKKQAAASLLRKEDDLRGIMDVLGQAAETLGGHNETHTSRLKDFATQLQLVSRGSDLPRMRAELSRRVEELRQTTDGMWRDNHTSVADMQVQLAEFQKRLEWAEDRACMDALTGLMNRGEGELRLRRTISDRKVVSIILVDLNGFKLVNDRWGHSAGDQVLKAFAHVLRDNVRPADTVSRWGGDEFLVMLGCNEEIARERAAQLRGKLRITAKIVVLGKVISVEAGASLGVAQARAGEPLEDLLTRADVELYGNKKPCRSPNVELLAESKV
jgi:diguanylate cyclase (GGDEF)-like protein